MPTPPQRSAAVDRDGVRVETAPGGARRVALLGLACAALAAGVAVVVATLPQPPDAAPGGRVGAPVAARGAARTLAPAAADDPRQDFRDDADRQVGRGLPPAGGARRPGEKRVAVPRRMSDEALLAALQRAERRGTIELGAPGTGIEAFPPPGTKPIKRGIIVPDGFELPPGYVRHHQTTDDGKQLPPVLTFHPDFEWIGPDGTPITLPEDRLVPPELAPEGMPIEILDVPEPRIEPIEPPGGPRVR